MPILFKIPIYPTNYLNNNSSTTSISSIPHWLIASCGHLIAITMSSSPRMFDLEQQKAYS